MRSNFTSIDEYIRSFPPETQKILHKIRNMLSELIPGAIQTISYQMPTFKLYGKYLIYFAAFKHHIGIYPGSDYVKEHAKELIAYKTSTGTIQLPIDKPIPYDLIKKVALYRKKVLDEKYG